MGFSRVLQITAIYCIYVIAYQIVINYMKELDDNKKPKRRELHRFYTKFKTVFLGDFKLLGFVLVLAGIGYIFY